MEMSNSFNFNAPQYVDFCSESALELSEYGEDYFDMDHELILKCKEENVEMKSNDEKNQQIVMTPKLIEQVKVEQYTPEDVYVQSNTSLQVYDDEDKENEHKGLRRSISAGNVAINLIPYDVEIQNAYNMEENLSQAVKALELGSGKKKRAMSGFTKDILFAKPNLLNGKSRHTSYSKPRSVCGSREELNRTSIFNSLKRKMSVEELGPNKFISTAEYVNKFHSRTPDRFHTKPKNTQLQCVKQEALVPTVPQSPMLNTKSRSRPVYYTPYEEKEQKQIEEMKKYHIKAHPMNLKIFDPPVLNVKVEKKPTTKPEPFKITEVKVRKPTSPKPAVFEFHARPAPKPVNHQPVIKQSILPRTQPITPSFMKIRKYKQDKVPAINENCVGNKVCVKSVDMHHDGISKIGLQKPTKTKIEPFSFEERNKRMMEKKEEKLKQFLEEEKKKREFHANPIPAQIKVGSCGPVQSKLNQTRDKSMQKSNETLTDDSEHFVFKARPATVVHKKPFIPIKGERPITAPCEFSLSTVTRAKEREAYEKKLKEREEEIESLRKQRDELFLRDEMEIVAQIRKETVYKANPIRHYKPFEVVHSTKKLTSPSSPAFTRRKAENKTQ